MHAVVLKYFLEVAKSGSIRKAAQTLFVSSTAVNRQILHLEEELGVKLFDRLPNGIRLTSSGERLLRHVRGTLHDYHLMRTELDSSKGERLGNVTVAALDSLLIELLPATVEEFSEMYPAVHYSILGMASSEIPDKVVAGDADIGVFYLGRLQAGLKVVYEGAFPNGVIMVPSHPLAQQDSVSFSDCANYPFLRLAGASPLQFMDIPEANAFWEGLTPAVVCNSTAMVRRLVASGRGISIFSKLTIVNELSRGELVWRPMNVPEANAMRIGVVVPTRRAMSHVTTQFLERLVKRLRQLELDASTSN